MRINRTGKIIVSIVFALLLMQTIACVPAVTDREGVAGEKPEKEVTPGPSVDWGILEIRVTDPPPADVKSAIIHLANIEVHRVSDNTTDNESGWVSVIGAPPSFDLMDVIGVEQFLGSVNITAGKFTQIRMDVIEVVGQTTDNVSYTAEVPSGKLRIVGPFEVGRGLTTVLTLDFDGEKSLILTGKDKALFKPVVKLLVEEKGKAEQEQEQEQEQEREGLVKGTIETINGDNWTVTIKGDTWIVDVSEAGIEGEPAVGLQVEIEGTAEDNVILASKVKILGADLKGKKLK